MPLIPILALLSTLARADDALSRAPQAPAAPASAAPAAPAVPAAPAPEDFALRPEETVIVKGDHGRAEFEFEAEQDGRWLPLRGVRVAMDGASSIACPHGERVSAVVLFASDDFAFEPAAMRTVEASAECGSRVVLRFAAANRQTRFLRAWYAAMEEKEKLASKPGRAAWPKDVRFVVGGAAADAPRARHDVFVEADGTTAAIEQALEAVLAEPAGKTASP